MTGLLAGIETGGTKVVAGVARIEGGEPVLIAPEIVVPTLDPEDVFDEVCAAIGEVAPGRVAGLGIASFGPVDLAAGRMLDTPKPMWSGFELAEAARKRVDAPLLLDTDVNAAALAEWRWGTARGTDVALYVTVGTGIGGGVVVGGKPVHGLLHPELGHIYVPRMPGDDFEGGCGSHGDCLEGMVAGPALRKRWGGRGEQLPDDHPAWDVVVWYLGYGLAQYVLALSPEVIVLGGGVMDRGLHDRVAARMAEALDGYVPAPVVTVPHFGARAGLMGAFALAAEAAGRVP